MNQQKPTSIINIHVQTNTQNVSPRCDPIKITGCLKRLQNSNWNHIMGVFPWTVINSSKEVKNLWKGQSVSTNSGGGEVGEPNLISEYTFTTHTGIPKRSISTGLNRSWKTSTYKQWCKTMTYESFTHHIQRYVILSAFEILAQVIRSEPYKMKHIKTRWNQKVWNVFACN